MSKASAAPVASNDFLKSNGTVSADHAAPIGGPSLTRQEFADECDVNNIMQRYEQHLADPMRSVRQPVYYDFTQMPDSLMEAMAVMNSAHDAFMTLPASVRKEFENDAAMFADFASNPENLEQMRTWGLAPPKKAPDAPMRVEVINPVKGDFNRVEGVHMPSAKAPEGGSTQ